MREYVQVTYVVRYAEGYGRGSFSELEFNTRESAREKIVSCVNHENEYWRRVGRRMQIIEKREVITEEEVENEQNFRS